MAPTATTTSTATPTATATTTILETFQTAISTTTSTTLHHLSARLPHHTPDPGSPPRSDAHMSDAERALKLRNLTIGWTLGIVGACIVIGVTIFCVVGKRRCCLRPRERDFTGFDARVASGGVPRAEEYDTRTDAQRRDERMIREREEEEERRKRERDGQE